MAGGRGPVPPQRSGLNSDRSDADSSTMRAFLAVAPVIFATILALALVDWLLVLR